MKHLFDRQSRSTLSNVVSTSEPPSPHPEPTIDFSTPPPSGTSTPGLHHLIPDDTADSEPEFTRTEDPIPLKDLFNFNNSHWIDLYNGHARKYLAEELALCKLLNQDAAAEEGAEVDVDEMTGNILIT